MGLFSYLAEWKQNIDMARIFRAGMSPFDIFKQIGKARETDAESLIKRYKDWVYICASKNASSVSQVPLRLYVVTRKGERKPKEWVHRKALDKKQAEHIWGKESLSRYTRKAVEIEEVVDHQFLDLWYDPNPYTAGFTFRELITIDQELVGDAFIYIYKDEVLGIPKELWRLPPQWTSVVPDPKEFIKGYLYGRNRTQRIALKPDEIIHFLYPNPRDPYSGMSPVEGAMSAVDIDDSMSKYDLTVMDNQGRPDFIVSYKGKLTPGKIEKLQKEWKRLHGGKPNVGRPTFLDQDAEIKTLGWSPREMAFLSGRKWSMKQICNAHGVPVSKVDVDNVNRANADAGNYTYMKDTIYPRCIRQEETLNQHIVQKYDDRLFVAYDNPVPEDKEYRLKERESNIKSAYSSVNQERQVDNLKPVLWGDVPLVPMNMIPLGSLPPRAQQQPPKDMAMMGYKRQDVPIDRPLPPIGTLPPMDADERRFDRLMRQVFGEQEKDVLRLLEKGLKGIDDATLNLGEWNVKLAEIATPQIVTQVDRAGNAALRQVGVEVAEWIERPETVQWVRDHTFQFARQVNRTTEHMLKESLALGVQNGESIPAFRKRIQEVFNLRRKESQMIARTEMNRAQNGGTVEAWKQSGIVVAQVWDAANDSCPFCYQMNGTEVALDGIFANGGSNVPGYVNDQPVSMPINYGDVHHPPLHPNSYDKKTEIYTSKGWRPVSEININDECLSLNPKTFDLEYVPVIKTYKHKPGEIVSFKSRNFDMAVTKDHNIFYQTDWNSKHNKDKWEFIKAHKLVGKVSGRMYRSSKWQGEDKLFVKLGSKEVSFAVYAEFIGWYLSEGSTLSTRPHVSISQSKEKKLDKWERINELLADIGFKYSRGKNAFVIRDKELNEQLKIFGGSAGKFIPILIKEATPAIIYKFLDTFCAGDGNERKAKKWKGGNFKNKKSYFTSSDKLADDIGELLIKIGRRPSYALTKDKGKKVKFKNGTYTINNDVWRIAECYSQYAYLHSMDIKIKPYKDYAYCVDLKKYHTLLTRRNGKVVWSGNCRCTLIPKVKEIE